MSIESSYFFHLYAFFCVINVSNILLCRFVFVSIETNEWNKHNGEIGAVKLADGVKEEDFIGAEKETSKYYNQ